MTRGPSGRSALVSLSAIFVLSGIAALVYQIAWMRQLTLLFGATVYAVSTILACFMGGLALGAAVGGRLGVGLRDPGKTYAYLEFAIAAAGALSVPVFALLPRLVAALVPRELTGPIDIIVRFSLAVPVLLLPTFIMGATLPVLARQVAATNESAARRVGLLYTCNTLGACVGAALAGYLLVPLLGMRGTVSVGVMLNLTAGLLALIVTRGAPAPDPQPPQAAAAGDPVPGLWLSFAFATGFGGLAVEVLWTRALVLYLGSSVYAYSSMLTVYLLGLAIGSAVGVRLLRRSIPAISILAVTQLLLALDLPLLIWQFGRLSTRLTEINRLVGVGTYARFSIASYLATTEILLPPTLLMGLSFPVLMAVVTRSALTAPREVGTLYAANTVGAISGAIAAPVLLIPLLGVQRSLLALSLLTLLLALVAISRTVRLRDAQIVPGVKAAGAGVAVAAYLGLYAWTCPADTVVRRAGVFRSTDASKELVELLEDTDATIAVERVGTSTTTGDVGTGWLSLSVNGVNVAGTSPDLVTIQKLQGHLPLLLVAERGRVLHIGFGSGGTAHAVSRHPVSEMVIAELSLGVIHTSDRFFRGVNHGVLEDERVRVVHKDGRNYLLARGEPFDVILSDSVHPRYSGNGALYSEEYYRRCRSQLRPGGVVSQWLPTYSMTQSNFRSILKAFCNVFPDTSVWYVNSTVNAFTIVIGHTRPFRIDLEELERRMAEASVARELEEVGVNGPVDLLDYFFCAGEAVTGFAAPAPAHVDDLPSVEYESMLVMNREAAWLRNFEDLLAVREPVTPYLDERSASERPGLVAELDAAYRATSRSLEGHRLIVRSLADPRPEIGRELRERALRVFQEAWTMNPKDMDPRGW